MGEYRNLKVVVFEDERFCGLDSGIDGFSTMTRGHIEGIFRTAKLYGGMDHAPGKIQSFHNPRYFRDFDQLNHFLPGLAAQVKTRSGDNFDKVRNITVHEAQLLDERVAAVFDQIPHEVVTEYIDL